METFLLDFSSPPLHVKRNQSDQKERDHRLKDELSRPKYTATEQIADKLFMFLLVCGHFWTFNSLECGHESNDQGVIFKN